MAVEPAIPEILNRDYEVVPIDRIEPHPDNPRQGDLETIGESIEENGFFGACVVWWRGKRKKGWILVGNHRWKSFVEKGAAEIPVLWVECDEERAKKILLSDNRSSDRGSYDVKALTDLLVELKGADGQNLKGTGYDSTALDSLLADLALPTEGHPDDRSKVGKLSAEFIAPPISILDRRSGRIRERRNQWLSLGLSGQLGREDDITYAQSVQGPQVYALRNAMREAIGRDPTWPEVIEKAKERGIWVAPTTSVFDPAILELMVSWYSRPGDRVLDPFAGGAVCGVVSSVLGRSFTGVEVREEQVKANVDQWKALAPKLKGARKRMKAPEWLVGDTLDLAAAVDDRKFDFVVSSPPYGDLEVYSEDPRDLSNLKAQEFDRAYEKAVRNVVSALEDDRFVAWIVGEVRQKRKPGWYRGFLSKTIAAFEKAGAGFYAEFTVLDPIMTAIMRGSRQFRATRKPAKSHQQIYIFVKGDPEKAVERLGDVRVSEIEEFADVFEGGD